MKYHQDDIDHKLEKIIKEKLNSSSKPLLSSDEAWEKIIENAGKEKKSKKNNPLKKSLVIVSIFILFIISATTLISPSNSSAFIKFSDIFHRFQDSVLHVFTKVGNDNMNEEDIPANAFQIIEENQMVTEDMDLSQANQISDFDIAIPSYIPNNYELKNVTVLRIENENTDNLFVNYEGENKKFRIHQIFVEDQLGAGGIVSSENGEIEEVIIRSNKGTFIDLGAGKTKIIWATPEMYYSIEGDLSKEDIIQIAKSM